MCRFLFIDRLRCAAGEGSWSRQRRWRGNSACCSSNRASACRRRGPIRAGRNQRNFSVSITARKRSSGFTFVNDLERPVFEKFIFLARLKMWLREQPEIGAAMLSGSGSTVFAVLREGANGDSLGQRARAELDPDLWTCACETLLNYSPSRLRRSAAPYSRLSFAMKLALISAGQTASHS